MNTKTTIYLIRHGECAGNKENRIRGCLDFPLNENGLTQAYALAEAMKDKHIEFIYSSPLSRATKTAQILGDALGLGVGIIDAFCNIRLGPWEGRLKAELAVETPELWNTWVTMPEDLRVEGAETLDQVMDRSLKGLESIIKERKGHTLAIVAHRGVLKLALAGALGIAKPRFWRLHMDNASYSLLTHDDTRGFCLMGLNFTEHLKGIPLVQEFE
ncbi:MAG: histidine phosphatase family protein [Synergistaceae bacterium]|nr:histidine phosphatase family protein [Synergistaceae bacterium]